jgi:hypothetical protein
MPYFISATPRQESRMKSKVLANMRGQDSQIDDDIDRVESNPPEVHKYQLKLENAVVH